MKINIDKYIIDKSCDTNYELIGVITYLGPINMSGYFIAFNKSSVDKEWYVYNDSQVKELSRWEESSQYVYVLFYMKENNITGNIKK